MLNKRRLALAISLLAVNVVAWATLLTMVFSRPGPATGAVTATGWQLPTWTVTLLPSATWTASPTSTPTDAPEPVFVSGGLGLDRDVWEENHGSGVDEAFMIHYDGGFGVMFADDRIQWLEMRWEEPGVTLEGARAQGRLLIPDDSQFIETYSPEGVPELIVDLYSSASLANRFDSQWWFGSESGTFIVIHGVFDDRVPSIVMATGNNP